MATTEGNKFPALDDLDLVPSEIVDRIRLSHEITDIRALTRALHTAKIVYVCSATEFKPLSSIGMISRETKQLRSALKRLLELLASSDDVTWRMVGQAHAIRMYAPAGQPSQTKDLSSSKPKLELDETLDAVSHLLPTLDLVPKLLGPKRGGRPRNVALHNCVAELANYWELDLDRRLKIDPSAKDGPGPALRFMQDCFQWIDAEAIDQLPHVLDVYRRERNRPEN